MYAHKAWWIESHTGPVVWDYLLVYKETKIVNSCAVQYGSHKVCEDTKIN